MAAVTVNSRTKGQLNGGNRRMHLANVSTAATGDTYTVPGMKKIDAASADPPSTTGVGIGISTNVITFNYTGGGAMSNIPLIVIGI